jgi:hypothetical protein
MPAPAPVAASAPWTSSAIDVFMNKAEPVAPARGRMDGKGRGDFMVADSFGNQMCLSVCRSSGAKPVKHSEIFF